MTDRLLLLMLVVVARIRRMMRLCCQRRTQSRLLVSRLGWLDCADAARHALQEAVQLLQRQGVVQRLQGTDGRNRRSPV